MIDRQLIEEAADRVVSKCGALRVNMWLDSDGIVKKAVIDALSEMGDFPFGEIATARALAERDGRSWLFKAGDAHKMGDQANILRQNYMSDARHLLARIRELLGKK